MATRRQQDYLRRLISEYKRLPPGSVTERTAVRVRSLTKWPDSMERASVGYASECIDAIKTDLDAFRAQQAGEGESS